MPSGSETLDPSLPTSQAASSGGVVGPGNSREATSKNRMTGSGSNESPTDLEPHRSKSPDDSNLEPTENRESQRFTARLLSLTPFKFLFKLFRGTKDNGESRSWTRLPAFLTSVILHCIVFLCLALWTVAAQLGSLRSVDFEAVSVNSKDEAVPVEMKLAAGDTPPPPQAVVETPTETSAKQSQASSVTISELLDTRAPVSDAVERQGEFERLLNASAVNLSASFSSTGVEGRKLKERKKIALARGGTMESEQAVEDALDWLAEHQRPNGAWSLIHSHGHCNGRCKNDGSKDRFDTAATGLSLLAFLGAGYTHLDGKHQSTVKRGVYFLLQVIEETPQGGSFMYQCERGMYNHGIAAFALCEAYQLTLDPDLKDAAQKAVDFIASAQNYRGGWGYLPKKPGDLTISGWQIMALKSAFAAGLKIPDSTIMKIDGFLDSQQSPEGTFFGYTKPGKSPTCTSIGLLVRLFRGMSDTDPRILDGALFFSRNGPSANDVYHNYYVSLFLFHIGGGLWENWNPVVRDHLVKTQSKYGHEAGSWYFDNAYGKEGGRVYTTAMAAMTLEVYYRYSPLYQQKDVDFKL